jgi:hypothetical protein
MSTFFDLFFLIFIPLQGIKQLRPVFSFVMNDIEFIAV